MSDVVISVDGLGKKYRLGANAGPSYKTIRESMVDVGKGPVRKLASIARQKPEEGEQGHRPEFWALRDVNFEVQQGEVLGIIGRNGAGKSTLLKILSQITEPTAGQVKINGRVACLLEVGTGFHPELTGRENIFLNGAILGMGRAEITRKFDEIVNFAEVEEFIDTPVKHYSSGMYLRLAFSVAAHLDPEILLVDEVLAVGDAEFQKKCIGKMGDVASQGRTVIFVSHNMNAVERLCRSALRLDRGTVVEYGQDVRALTHQYLFGPDGSNGSAEWTNSGVEHENAWFKPLRASLVDETGAQVPGPCTNDQQVRLEIEGEVRSLDPALCIGYAIYSEDGALLYWSYQTDGPPSSWPTLRLGHCFLRSQIPRHLLNEGTYRVEIICSLHFREWLLEPGANAPSLNLTIQGGLSESPYWMVRRPGVLAPVLAWEMCEGKQA